MGPCRNTEDRATVSGGNDDDIIIIEDEVDISTITTTANARTTEDPEMIDSTEAWATAEGYTPLSDLNHHETNAGNSFMMASMSPDGGGIDSSTSSDRDDDDDDNNDNNDNENGDDRPQGTGGSALNENSSVFINSNELDISNNEANNAEVDNFEADNFEELAAIALSALDGEYQQTLSHAQQQMNDGVHITTSEGQNSTNDVNTDIKINNNNDNTNEKEDLGKIIANGYDRRKEELKEIGKHGVTFPVRWEELEEEASTRKDHKQQEHEQHVDTNAVRKAIETLSTKNKDASFHQKFAKWQMRQQHHALIPVASCKAFCKAKSTEKSRMATKNLSRSATISEAVVRLSLLSSLPSTDILLIDIVGVDHVECENESTIRDTFGPFVRWLGNYYSSPSSSAVQQQQQNDAARRVHFRLIGRDLIGPTTAAGNVINLLTSISIQATASCHSGVYHEFLEEEKQKQTAFNNSNSDSDNNNNDNTVVCHDKNIPDLILAFNAGIWGYEEWGTTIRYLAQQQDATSMIITSYTFDECEDDNDVIIRAIAPSDTTSDNIASNTDSISCRAEILWKPEQNPFGSEVIRETNCSPQPNRENACWQAWLLGGKTSDTEFNSK